MTSKRSGLSSQICEKGIRSRKSWCSMIEEGPRRARCEFLMYWGRCDAGLGKCLTGCYFPLAFLERPRLRKEWDRGKVLSVYRSRPRYLT